MVRRPRRLLPALALLAAAAAAVGATVAAVRGSDRAGSGPTLPRGVALDAVGSLQADTHLFGDRVLAAVDVALDRRRIDPERIRLDASFAPYEPVDDVRPERRDFGPLTELRYRIVLRCLTFPCVPFGPASIDKKTFRLRPARVLYDGSGVEPVVVRWPAVEARSRWKEATGFERTPYKATLVPLPNVSYRIQPAALAALALGGALLLLLVPGRLVALEVRRRRRRGAIDPLAHLSPLERALVLVEQVPDRANGGLRRGALERLALELARSGHRDLGSAAGALAWSPASPGSEDATALTERVRAELVEVDGRPR